MCQGFSHIYVFCIIFVLAKLATSSIRVNGISNQGGGGGGGWRTYLSDGDCVLSVG